MIAVGNGELRSHADRLLASPVSRGDLALAFEESAAETAEVLVEGKNFYPRMLEDIAAASTSIHINQFGFRPGAVGDRFAEALLAKAKEGVPVRLLVDSQGSDPERGTKDLYERLCAAGARSASSARPSRAPRSARSAATAPLRWNLGGLGHIDHRKVVVVDGRIGWVGGAGIEDHFEDGRFHDLFLRVKGPVVSQLQLVFVASLRWLGGEFPASELDGLFPPLDEGPGPIPAVVLHNAPGRFRPITDAIAELLDGARETLDVVNPYVTDRKMIGRIEAAADRGARVRLFVPANPNNWACGAAEQFHHGRLLDAGVRILGLPEMLHAKAFVRDGERGARRHLQPRGLESEAVLRDRPRLRSAELAAQFDERFFAARGRGLSSRTQADRAQGASEGDGVRRALAAALASYPFAAAGGGDGGGGGGGGVFFFGGGGGGGSGFGFVP